MTANKPSTRRGNFYKHGMYKTRPYRTWSHLKGRCNNKNDKNYHNYGGRGITYDPRWETFEGFWKDMKDGYKDNLTIDRIDNNGNYCKKNCRWISWKQQAYNRRTNRLLTYGGKTKTLLEWANLFNIKRTTLRMRLDKYNYSIEKALNERVTYNHDGK